MIYMRAEPVEARLVPFAWLRAQLASVDQSI
jgi:hypothetical protein